MHHFILQLEKNVTPDECLLALDDFMSSIIDYHVYEASSSLKYLFFEKSDLLGRLSAKLKHIQTNNHIFLVISE